MTNVEYRPIEPSLSHVRAVQRLTLQDVVMGDFPNPESIANPNSLKKLVRQYERLKSNPDNYLGAYIDGRVRGYLKTGPWNIADQLPFAYENELPVLNSLLEQGVTTAPKLKLGIFGLVVSNELNHDDADAITDRFLHMATDKALHLRQSAVNIVFHENDPVQPIAMEQGFRFTGRMGEAAGAPHLQQRLYSKPLDL